MDEESERLTKSTKSKSPLKIIIPSQADPASAPTTPKSPAIIRKSKFKLKRLTSSNNFTTPIKNYFSQKINIFIAVLLFVLFVNLKYNSVIGRKDYNSYEYKGWSEKLKLNEIRGFRLDEELRRTTELVPKIETPIPKKIPKLTFQPTTTIPNPNFIFHNKMPKCGSTTFLGLTRALKNKNNFNFEIIGSDENLRDKPVETMDRIKEILQANDASSTSSTNLIMQHQPFINFTDFDQNFKMPTYINVVRNPIDRYVSNYYFCRFGSGTNPVLNKGCANMSPEEINLPANEYFGKINYKISIKDINFLIWICGNGHQCSKVNKANEKSFTENDIKIAYQYAKKLVIEEYFLIGLLEEFEKSLKLFEFLLPDIFKGASYLYAHTKYNKKKRRRRDLSPKSPTSSKTLIKINRMTTNKKIPISNETRSILEEGSFKYDMDLYKFIEWKFFEQYGSFFSLR